MKSKTSGLAALLVLSTAAPALAGSVYVPVATDQVIDGVRYRTQVWVTNSDSTLRQFTTYYIPTETDGTARPENWGESSAVPANSTLLLGSVAGSGEIGMLEISGADHMVVTARMVGTRDGVTGLGAAMPVIGSKNLFAAGNVAHNQGWVRSGDLRSDFGLVNLGSADANCSISVFRNDGSQIQGTAVIGLRPLTQRQFDDALGILGVDAISAVRSETTCDQPFYSYLRTYDRTSGDVFLTLPTHTVGESLLEPPGTEPPPAECSQAAAFCFSESGVFFTPTRGNQVTYIDFPVPAGDYRRLHAKLSFRHGGWNSARPGGAHNVFWLVRDRRHFDLYGYINVYGPPNSEILWRHGIAQGAAQKARIVQSAVFVPGRLYHIDYDYDAGRRRIELNITDDQGQTIVSLNDRTNVNVVRVNPGEPYSLGLSFFEGENPNELPTYGWQYSNFVAEFYD